MVAPMDRTNLVDSLRAVLHADAANDMPDIDRVRTALATATPNEHYSGDCPRTVSDTIASLNTDRLVDPDRSLTAAVQASVHTMHWRISYAHHDDLPELHAGYFVSTIINTADANDALLHSDLASLYFTIQCPRVHYFSHVHKAPELYHVIAGNGEWQKGGRPFELQPEGAWIDHPSGTRHAMQTLDEPMLSLAMWTDDLNSVPVIITD